MDAYLEIQKLKCGYESKFHIQDISFSIPKGSFAGIIGPNGSGKTTLFRGIAGELKAKEGKVILDGENLHHLPVKQRAQRMAVVNQTIEAAYITVEDYVMMGRLPYQKRFHFFESREDFVLVEKYLKMADIYHLKDKYMSQLSGGEQQMAGIVRALCQEPDLLLLDEPTSHLDINHQVHILNLIQRLKDQLGITVLMIVHDLNLAGEYCDYLVMMQQGRIHTAGKPEEVLNYAHIEEVYSTVVVTDINPISKKPVVFLVSEKLMREVRE